MIVSNIALITIIAMSMSLIVKKRIEKTLPMAMFSIILILFVSAVLGYMGRLMYPILWGIAGISLFSLGIIRYKQKRLREYSALVITPGLLGFLLLASFMWWFCAEAAVVQWDEFSHWALTVKDMYLRDVLSTDALATTGFKTYPPAMALWEYFFVEGNMNYSEGAVYYAYNLFLVILMMPFFQRLRWQQCYSVPIVIIVIFLLPYLFYTKWEGIAWNCLYIDHALAFAFAYALCSYFGEDKKDAFVYVRTGCALAVLGLLKSTGNFTAAIAIVCIAVDTFWDSSKDQKRKIKNLLVALVPWLVAILIWEIHLKTEHVGKTWDTSKITVDAIARLISGHDEPWKYEFSSSFLTHLMTPATQSTGNMTVSFILHPL